MADVTLEQHGTCELRVDRDVDGDWRARITRGATFIGEDYFDTHDKALAWGRAVATENDDLGWFSNT